MLRLLLCRFAYVILVFILFLVIVIFIFLLGRCFMKHRYPRRFAHRTRLARKRGFVDKCSAVKQHDITRHVHVAFKHDHVARHDAARSNALNKAARALDKHAAFASCQLRQPRCVVVQLARLQQCGKQRGRCNYQCVKDVLLSEPQHYRKHLKKKKRMQQFFEEQRRERSYTHHQQVIAVHDATRERGALRQARIAAHHGHGYGAAKAFVYVGTP
mmetsp:Transcript_14873/g.39826  ORF Transcript_14873/g.39826 Transcript_14873/m.39826 type:complete len:215 (-) Transcript_14873:749-1393(-)